MPKVYRNGIARSVLNLGWLLRHRKDVRGFVIAADPTDAWACHMTAILPDGCYTTRWADHSVLLQWIHRPVFRTLPVYHRAPDGAVLESIA